MIDSRKQSFLRSPRQRKNIVTDTILIVQHSSSLDGSAFSGLLTANCLRDAGWRTCVAFGHMGPMVAIYQNSGHETWVVEHKNWLRRSHPARFAYDALNEWRTSSRFTALLNLITPQIVYINSAVSLAGSVAASKMKIPCIWHLRELPKSVGGELDILKIAMPLVRLVIGRYSTKIVCNSLAVTKCLSPNSSPGKAEVVANAIGDAFFTNNDSQENARRSLGLLLTGVLVAVPSSMRPVKGHQFLFESAKRVVERYPDTQFVLSGHGSVEYVEHVKRVVRQCGMENHVRFLGSVTEMPTFYRACDVVCVPSRSESFGRVVIEAFASGVPVVATAVGGIPEIIDHDVDGLLVAYGDTDGLVTALEELITDRSLRERLSAAAYQKAKERYSEHVHCATMCRLVESVVRP